MYLVFSVPMTAYKRNVMKERDGGDKESGDGGKRNGERGQWQADDATSYHSYNEQ